MNIKSSNEPLVSVIINCFNGAKYLNNAIESVINQSYKNWEIIFWDNCSTDKSAEIFNNYNDKRLNYYCAESHSNILYKAKNYALKKAKGEFIAFLDVDDWWTVDKLEKQIPLFKNSETGLVYGNRWIYFEKKKKKKIFRKKKLPTGMILKDLLNDYVIGSATYVIRKKILENSYYNFNDNFHIIGDFDLSIRISSRWRIDCIQSPIAFVRIHDKNESLLKRSLEITEMKVWYKAMKKNTFFSNIDELDQIKFFFLYLETMEFILNHNLKKSFFKVIEYPFCLKKIKLLIALLLPKFIIKKIKNY